MSIMPHMINEYQQKRIEFRKILLGILSERNRWSQCVEWTNKKLGMAVGALFIRDNFNHESKVSIHYSHLLHLIDIFSLCNSECLFLGDCSGDDSDDSRGF